MKSRTRKRAVGTRDRVMSHLTAVGEIRDENGMASTVLADAVGYPGSSIAFAQLLSGMERSGLIEREVRGKRTYLITPAEPAATRRAQPPRAGSRQRPGSGKPRRSVPEAPADLGQHDLPVPGEGDGGYPWPGDRRGGFDYDELARRLLIQVVRRLAGPPAEDSVPAPGTGAAAGREAAAITAADRPLEETVASLEQKLASVQTRQRTLTEENAKLREQLHEAQRSLATVQERASRPRITEQLNSAEGVLLERLLALAQEKRGEETGTG